MKFIKFALTIAAWVLVSAPTIAQTTILSGPVKGSYSQFAIDIVKVLNEKNDIKLINKTSAGSGYNFKAITDPESSFKVAFIQSDYLNMMEAEDRLKNTNKTGSLKVIMPLATEQIHVLAKKSSGLTKLQDLSMKNVGIGNEYQGSFATATMMKERSKIAWNSYQVTFNDMLKSIVSGSIDAGIFVGSAPLNLLDVDPQAIVNEGVLLNLDNFNGWAKFYDQDTIYSVDYKWLENDVPTFGVRTLLVVNEAKLSNTEKEELVKIKAGIIQNLDYLKKNGHPRWRTVIIPDDNTSIAQPKAKVKSDSKTSPEPAQASAVKYDEVTYRVQIYSRNYDQAEELTIDSKNYSTFVYSYLGAYRYTVGEFKTLAEAANLQKSCRDLGYKQAFVAAFKNGKRDTDPELFK